MANYKNKTKLELIAEITRLEELNDSLEVENITEPKNPEDELKKHKDMFELVINSVPARIFWKDLNSVYLGCNSTFAKAAGEGKIENIIGKTDFDLIWAKDAQRYIDDDRSVIKTGQSKIGYEEDYTLADGEKVWWHTSKMPLKDRAGKIIGILCASEDITESKRVTEKLKESEEKFRSVFENSPIGKSITGIDGSLEVNKSFCDIVGFSEQELKTKNWREITHPDDISISTDVTQELLDGIKDRVQFEKRYIHKNGSIVWTDVVTALERDNDNKPEYFITSIQNITEKKISEQAIRENEVRYRELVDSINSGVVVYKVINDGKTGKDYIIEDFNKAALKLEGLEKKQVLGKSLFDIRPNIDDYGLIPIFEKVWRTKEPDYFPSKEYTDNKYSNYYENRVFCLPNGDIVAVYDDVTEQENAVLLLKRNQERLDLALNATKDGIYDWNLVSNDIYYSPPWKSMLGYKDDELPNDFSIWEKLTKPEDVERSWKMQQELISKQRDRFEMEFKMKHKNGHWVDIFSRAEAVFDESGKAIRVVGTHVDITERKKAEYRLIVSEGKFKKILEGTPLPLCYINKEGLITFRNNRFVEIFGYSEKDVPSLKEWWQKAYPNEEYRNWVIQNWEQAVKNASEKNTDIKSEEYQLTCKDGSKLSIIISGITIGENVLATFSDITERKQFIKKLQERNEYIESLMENMPIGFAINAIDDGEVKYMNNRFEDIYGWSRDILTNTSVFFEKVFPEPKYREKMTTQIITDLQSGDPKRMIWKDLKIVTSTGEVRYVSAYNIPLLDQNLMISTVQDTTQVKLAEDEITKHREHLEVMVKERTKDLEDKNKELERFNDLFVDREFRIKELKDEIEKLSK